MNQLLVGKNYHSNTRANNQKSVMNKKQSECCSKIKQRKENQAHSLKKVLLSRLNDNDLVNQHKARERVDRIKIQFNFNRKTSLDINLPSTMTINELRQLSFSFLKIHKKSCCESNYTYCGLYVENPFKILLKNIQIQDLKNVQSLKSQDKDEYYPNQLQFNHQVDQNSIDFRCQMKQILSKLSQLLSQFIWQSIILSSKQRKDISSSELTLKQLRFQDSILSIQQKEGQHQLSRKKVSPSFSYLFSHPSKNHDLLKVFAKYQAPFPKEKISAKENKLLTQSTKNNYFRIPDLNLRKESIFKPYQNEKKKYFSISEYIDDSFKNSKSIFSRQVKKKYTSRIIKQLLSNELDHDYLNQVSGGQSYQNSQNHIEEQENILKLNQSFHLNRKRLENGQDMQKDIYQMEYNSDTAKNLNQRSTDNFENQGNENIYIKQHTESPLSKSQSNKELTSDQQVQSPKNYDEHITFQPAQSYSVKDLDKCYEYLQNLLKKFQVVEWAAALNMLNRNCPNQEQPAQNFNQKTIDWSFCIIPIRIQNQPEIYNLCIFDLKVTNDKSIRNFSRIIQQLFTTHNCILDCNLLQLYSFTEINNYKKTQQSKRIRQKVNSHKDSHDSRKIKCGKFLIKLSNKMNTKLSLISYIGQVLRIKYSDQFMQKEFQSINHQIVILLRQLLNSNIFQTLMKKKNLQKNTYKLNSQKIKHNENLWKIFLLNPDNNLKNKYQYEKYPLLSLFCVDLDNFDSSHGTLYLEAQEIIKRLKMIFQNLMTDSQKQNFCFNSKQNFNFMNKPDELNELTHKKQAKDHHNGQNLLEVMMQKVTREFQQVNAIIWSKKHQMRYHKKLIPLNPLYKAHLIETSNHFIAQCSKTIQINNKLNAKQSFGSKSDKIQVNSLQKLLKFMLSQFQKQKQIYHRKITEASNLLFRAFPTNFLQLLDFYLAQDTREFRAEQDLNIYEKQTTYKKKKPSSKSYWNDRSDRNSLNLLQDIQTSSFHEYDSLLNLSKKQKVPYKTTKSQQKNKNRRNESKCLKVQNLITINQKSIPNKRQHK